MANRNLVQHHGNVREQLNAALPMGLVRNDKLSATAKAVALEIWSHTEGRHQSSASVAEALRINRRTAASGIAELQEQRWLAREVHYKISENGNQVWDREVWHLQMSNTPFTESDMDTLCTQYTGTCAPGIQPPVHSVHNIEVKGRSAPEVHSDNRSEEGPVHVVHRPWEHSPNFGGSCSEPGDSEPDVFDSVSSFGDSISSGESISSSGDALCRIADPFASLATSASSSQGESWDFLAGVHEPAVYDSGDPTDPWSSAFQPTA